MSSEIPKSVWLRKERRREVIGEGFEHGLVLGTCYHFGKGYLSSEKSKLRAGLSRVGANSIKTCGIFSGLYFVYAAVDCAATYYLQKDTPIITVASSAVVASIVTAKRGPLFCFSSVVAFSGFSVLANYYADKLDAHDLLQKQQTDSDTDTPSVD